MDFMTLAQAKSFANQALESAKEYAEEVVSKAEIGGAGIIIRQEVIANDTNPVSGDGVKKYVDAVKEEATELIENNKQETNEQFTTLFDDLDRTFNELPEMFVVKEDGKGLSTNDFTNGYKNQLNYLGTLSIDDEMSDTSTNLVQNKVIKDYVDGSFSQKARSLLISILQSAVYETDVSEKIGQLVDELTTVPDTPVVPDVGESTNIFNGNYVVGKLAAGNVSANDYFYTTEYLPLKNGETQLYCKYYKDGNFTNYARGYYFYDENKTKISGKDSADTVIQPFAIPDSAKYVRICVAITYAQYGQYAYYIGYTDSTDETIYKTFSTEVTA